VNKNRILIALSESDQTKVGKEDFELQSGPQKVFSSIWTLESEVNNGGFCQYFSNSDSAETTAFVAEALETIGALKAADICKRAINCAFPAGVPSKTQSISDAANDFTDATLEKLEALDTEFMAYPDDLTDLLFAYVARHPDEFGELPQPDEA
jgi:hypothetical protein